MTPLFEQAFETTVLNPQVEGGMVLTNHATDPGGETFAGISRKYNPRAPIWPLVDAHKRTYAHAPPGALTRALAEDRILHAHVRQFYHDEFWHRINGDSLPPRVALQVFDMAVNSDPKDAVRTLQAAIGPAAGLVDGVAGIKTCTAARAVDPLALCLRFNGQRLRHYTTRPSRQAWLDNGRGWANRVAYMLALAAE